MDKRIGAQLFTLRDFCKNADDLSKTLEKVRQIGYKTIQVSGVSLDIPAKEVKLAADKNDLEIICTHLPYDKYVNELSWVIDYQKTLDCPIAGLGSAPLSLRESVEGLDAFINDFNKISKTLKENDIDFGYHNHAFEFVKIDGKYIMDYMAEKTDPDSFNFILDVYWLAFAGIDPAKYIKKLGKRAMVIHFKDLKALSNNSVTMCEVMEGNLNWDEIIKACEEAGCRAALVEQDKCDTDPFECMKLSYNNLLTKGMI